MLLYPSCIAKKKKIQFGKKDHQKKSKNNRGGMITLRNCYVYASQELFLFSRERESYRLLLDRQSRSHLFLLVFSPLGFLRVYLIDVALSPPHRLLTQKNFKKMFRFFSVPFATSSHCGPLHKRAWAKKIMDYFREGDTYRFSRL